MRIALHATGEVGRRTGRILLAEKDLGALGLYGQQGATEERKSMAIRELTGFSVLASDEPAVPDALGLASIAADDGLSAVLTVDPEEIADDLAARFRSAGTTLLVGAALPGVAASLAAHEAARVEDETAVTIAWTVPGSPIRSGEAIPFPGPVGGCWGRTVATRDQEGVTQTLIEVPVDGPWAAAMAKVEAGRRRARIVGVADLGVHIEAIALAAGVLAVVEGAFPPGVWEPSVAAEAYLRWNLHAGLEVATYTVRR